MTYLEHLKRASQPVCRVALADKLDNARSLLADYRQIGDTVWSRFNAGPDEQLWFYRSLVQSFREAGVVGPLIDEFARVVSELEEVTMSNRELR